MKKLMMLMLGAALAIGSVSVYAAQDTKATTKKSTKAKSTKTKTPKAHKKATDEKK
jgi:hypothetical protein